MSRTVTALYDTPEEADRALRLLKAGAPVAHADSYDCSPGSLEKLQNLDLTQEELVACRLKLAGGGYLLLAQVERGRDPQSIVAALERISEAGDPASSPAPSHSYAGTSNDDSEVTAGQPPMVTEEERLASPEQAVRVGTRQLVRGGAAVRFPENEGPRLGEVELIEEFVRVDKRPATRLVSDQELEQGGLLRDRLIEIAQMREEPVIEKEAFVREEVVVTKAIERRVEQVHEPLQHTEAELKARGTDRGGTAEKDRLETLEGNHGRS